MIAEFGTDIDTHTNCEGVLPDRISNDDITALKVAILEVVKHLPEFHKQKPKKLIIRTNQLN